ncbi:unnamed protein product [Darwinula stevensoni]|uniref:Uncharacterized protein n=1 Tax=Darwinula stevensoni TaxID=69355 RepID=A0A7R9FRM7_9CRUS|nr:unnamed protein product [Darwinula stevensoni]CAG0901724.1 unnamed protein product [Darwinula stevensoni]
MSVSTDTPPPPVGGVSPQPANLSGSPPVSCPSPWQDIKPNPIPVQVSNSYMPQYAWYQTDSSIAHHGLLT